MSLWFPFPLFAGDLRAVVLGIAQDGGVPHIGCTQALCVDARRGRVRFLHLNHTNRLLWDAAARSAAAAEGIVAARDGDVIALSAKAPWGVPVAQDKR